MNLAVKRGGKRLSAKLRVVNRQGMHLRAAGEIVKLTTKFKAAVELSYRGQAVNGKSLMGVMSLAVPPRGSFTAKARGADAAQLLRALSELVADGFGEDRGAEDAERDADISGDSRRPGL